MKLRECRTCEGELPIDRVMYCDLCVQNATDEERAKMISAVLTANYEAAAEPKPPKLRQLPQPGSDVRETLEKALEQADGFDGVVVIAMNRDGTQWMRGSTMSGMQKAFLFSFHLALMSKWFRLEDDV